MTDVRWEKLPQLETEQLEEVLLELEAGSPAAQSLACDYKHAKDTKTRKIANWQLRNHKFITEYYEKGKTNERSN